MGERDYSGTPLPKKLGVGDGSRVKDNKSCSIDDTWTAVRFVRRLEDR